MRWRRVAAGPHLLFPAIQRHYCAISGLSVCVCAARRGAHVCCATRAPRSLSGRPPSCAMIRSSRSVASRRTLHAFVHSSTRRSHSFHRSALFLWLGCVAFDRATIASHSVARLRAGASTDVASHRTLSHSVAVRRWLVDSYFCSIPFDDVAYDGIARRRVRSRCFAGSSTSGSSRRRSRSPTSRPCSPPRSARFATRLRGDAAARNVISPRHNRESHRRRLPAARRARRDRRRRRARARRVRGAARHI